MDHQPQGYRSIKIDSLPVLEVTTAFLLITGAIAMAITTIASFAHFSDVAYPDSAMLLRVQGFLSTGKIYPDFNSPPYLVTLYGPLCYVFLGSLHKMAQWLVIEPRTLIRIGMFACLGICAIMTYRVSQRLYVERRLAFLALLFAISTTSLASFAITIRGDLLALALSLSSFYLYLGKLNGRERLASGIFAGLALLVKQTFVAVPCAILIWHLWRREFREGLVWSLIVVGVVFFGYATIYFREPLIAEHFKALSAPVFEISGALRLIGEAFLQPQTIIGSFGVFLAIREGDSRKSLFACYWCISWVVAILSVLQIGGHQNYFWEPLFVSAVGVGHALVCLVRYIKRSSAPLKIWVTLLVFSWFFFALKAELSQIAASFSSLKEHDQARAEWDLFLSRIKGRRILSTLPEISVQSRVPEIPDPFLSNVLAQRGKWDFSPILREIRSRTYELVVVKSDLANGAAFHRGLGIWPPSVWDALKSNYVRACVLGNVEVWLPRDTDSSRLLRDLSTTTCRLSSAHGHI